MLQNLRYEFNGCCYPKYDDDEVGMIIPCSAMVVLAFKKPTTDIEYDKCPICGEEIYACSNGMCGHK